MRASLNRTPTDTIDRPTDGLTVVSALGRQVVVRTTTPGATRAVASLFRNMHEPLRPDVILGSVELQRVRTGWIVPGGPDGDVVHGSLSQARWELRERVTYLLMHARPDLLWLHAAGVVRDGNAVLISGPSGSGKSALATRLIGHGFDYLGDDVLPLDPQTGRVHPFPVTPAVRSGPSHCMLAVEARRLPRPDVVVRRTRVATGPMPVAAIVFPRFAPGPSRAQPEPPARVALELLRQCLDFERHRAAAVLAISALAGAAPAWSVSFADPGCGAEVIIRARAAHAGPLEAPAH
jgi:hypothetical protein